MTMGHTIVASLRVKMAISFPWLLGIHRYPYSPWSRIDSVADWVVSTWPLCPVLWYYWYVPSVPCLSSRVPRPFQ